MFFRIACVFGVVQTHEPLALPQTTNPAATTSRKMMNLFLAENSMVRLIMGALPGTRLASGWSGSGNVADAR
jgi:hypothetical protein